MAFDGVADRPPLGRGAGDSRHAPEPVSGYLPRLGYPATLAVTARYQRLLDWGAYGGIVGLGILALVAATVFWG